MWQTHGRVHAVRAAPHRPGNRDRPGRRNRVPGLFAAGDPVGNFRADIAGAATYGWIAGGSAAKRVQAFRFEKAEQSPTVAGEDGALFGLHDGGEGPDWRESNVALQQLMKDYAGIIVRSETLSRRGSGTSRA